MHVRNRQIRTDSRTKAAKNESCLGRVNIEEAFLGLLIACVCVCTLHMCVLVCAHTHVHAYVQVKMPGHTHGEARGQLAGDDFLPPPYEA